MDSSAGSKCQSACTLGVAVAIAMNPFCVSNIFPGVINVSGPGYLDVRFILKDSNISRSEVSSTVVALACNGVPEYIVQPKG